MPGRKYVRDGVLQKLCRKEIKPRFFFLFNDVLVYGSKTATGALGSQHVIKLSEMSVNESCTYTDKSITSEITGLPHAFQINSPEKSFHVYAATEDEKRSWIKDIRAQIRDARPWNEPAPKSAAVWVPDSQAVEVGVAICDCDVFFANPSLVHDLQSEIFIDCSTSSLPKLRESRLRPMLS